MWRILLSFSLLFVQSLIFNLMLLTQSYSKYKFENTTTYLFKNDTKDISMLEVTKQKSGYEVVFNSEYQDFYRRTDGLKDMNAVKKYIESFNF